MLDPTSIVLPGHQVIQPNIQKDIKKYIDRFNMFSIISEVLRVTAGAKEKAILRR